MRQARRRHRDWRRYFHPPLGGNEAIPLQLHIIVPAVMCCALLLWIGRGMSWTTRLAVTAVTLAVIICIVLFERSGFY